MSARARSTSGSSGIERSVRESLAPGATGGIGSSARDVVCDRRRGSDDRAALRSRHARARAPARPAVRAAARGPRPAPPFAPPPAPPRRREPPAPPDRSIPALDDLVAVPAGTYLLG